MWPDQVILCLTIKSDQEILQFENQIRVNLVLIIEVVLIVTNSVVLFKLREKAPQSQQGLIQVEEATKVLQDRVQDEQEDKDKTWFFWLVSRSPVWCMPQSTLRDFSFI